MFVYNIMKGGNSDSKAPEVQGYDYENVGQYGSVDMNGGKGKKRSSGKGKSPKFEEFDFQKEWKEFEESYNQKYGGGKTKAKKAKKPAKKASSSTKKKPAKKGAKKATKRKTQRGGDESGATFAPAQMFDGNTTMNAPSNGPFQSAYGTINAVDGLDRNLAPYPNSSGAHTGGAKKKKGSKAKKTKTATKTAKPKKDSKKTKPVTKATGKKESVLDKIKKFFAM